MRRVALIIVHYRTTDDTLECVKSALQLRLPDDTSSTIIVVDNGSGDDSWVALNDWAGGQDLSWHAQYSTSNLPDGVGFGTGFRFAATRADVVLLRSDENRGYASGCNLGIQFALQDAFTTHFWVLNSDLVIEQSALTELLRASELRAPAIYGATLLYHDDPRAIQAAGGAEYLPPIGRSRHLGKGRDVSLFQHKGQTLDYIVGAAMFFPREVIDTVGLLPEHFFLYFEETEWCARARERGLKMIWVPEARAIHKEGKSTGAAGRFRRLSDLSFRYIVRNSLLFSEDRYPLWLPTVFMYNVLETVRYCMSGDRGKLHVFWRAIREYWSMRSAVKSYS